MSFDFSTLLTSTAGVGKMATDFETSISTKMSDTAALETSAGMLEMQSLMNKWNVAVNLQSSMVKNLGDGLKGIVQKF